MPRTGKPTVEFPEYDLAKRLKYLRTTRGLTQADLAKACKLSQPTIASIENGTKDPSVNTLRKVALALDVEIAALFASDTVHVFDLRRLRRKYSHRDKLTPHLYMALAQLIKYARDIGMVED